MEENRNSSGLWKEHRPIRIAGIWLIIGGLMYLFVALFLEPATTYLIDSQYNDTSGKGKLATIVVNLSPYLQYAIGICVLVAGFKLTGSGINYHYPNES
jgi:hypothetical protein